MIDRRKRNDEKKDRAYGYLERERTAVMHSPVIIREKETITEVVKVGCRYCGGTMDAAKEKCPHCGALRRLT